MLNVTVRFKEKDATVRYEQRKVTLDQILNRYDDTPFDVRPVGPVITVAYNKQVTVRGWSQRTQVDQQASQPDARDKKAPVVVDDEGASMPVQLFVELVPAKGFQITAPAQLSLSDPPASGLAVHEEFQRVPWANKPSDDKTGQSGDERDTTRFVAHLTEVVALKPGEIILPVGFRMTTINEGQTQHEVEGRLEVVLRTPQPKSTIGPAATGVALIGGTLQLRLGHLCKQKGCVAHFHQSLREIAGLGGVRPNPNLQDPRATVYLRAGQAIDVWGLREKLRDQGVEIIGLVPRQLDAYRIRVELPRWRVDEQSGEIQQCQICRERTAQVIEYLAWTDNIEVAGGGINFCPTTPDVELVELLDAIAKGGTAPLAVWLVPVGAPMPKPTPPQFAQPGGSPKQGGSLSHPVVEFDFGHTCVVGTDVLAVLGGQKWASRTRVESEEVTIARAAIADRKYANLSPLLEQLRAAGRVPRQIRLRGFGDIRIQIEFAYICGEVEYSKPPKRRKASKKNSSEKKDETEQQLSSTNSASEQQSDKVKTETGKETKQKQEPFIPKPLRPATTSNSRQAIEAAVNRVDWIKRAVFHDYHTRPEFIGPRKLMISLEAHGEDVVRFDELIQALRAAGFPPKSVIVSRRFSGIPFAKPLPGDLKLTDLAGTQQSLASLKQPDRPLAVAFVSLKCRRHKKYKADPKLYQQLARTVDKYKDRVDFVAVSANRDDKFADVAEFWDKAGLAVPLFHDAAGTVRSVFNSQATPAPHLFVFDADGRFRFAGDPHDNWHAPDKPQDDYLAKALEMVLAGKYQANGAVFFNKSLCNCSEPKCKCPKCGCGPTCRCAIKH